MRKNLAFLLGLLLPPALPAQPDAFQFFVTDGDRVRALRNELVRLAPDAAPDFTIDTKDARQTMRGFGGAFNEQGWAALQALDEPARQELMKRIFSPSEANFTWGRIPIGASDYALERYTLAPVEGDFAMEHFSLERDKKYLIPYLKAAQAWQPGLRLWGSAWSPPVWMKDNKAYEAGRFIGQPEYYRAYALYLAKFVEEYRREGLPVEAVAVQNEPTVVTGYPNGGWTPAQFRVFIRDFCGPLFCERQVPAGIWLGTLNEGNYRTFAKTVLDDPAAKQFVAAVGLQWDGDQQIPQILRNHPGIPIIQTETDCGNWTWRPGFDREHAPNDFRYAAYTWSRIRDYLTAGAEAYLLWNIILDQDGKNIDRKLPWPQNSAIVVDTVSRQVTYTPMFRAFEHFSRFVPPGSVCLAAGGATLKLAAFRDPAGRTILQLLNDADQPARQVARVDGRDYALSLPPRSFATLVLGN